MALAYQSDAADDRFSLVAVYVYNISQGSCTQTSVSGWTKRGSGDNADSLCQRGRGRVLLVDPEGTSASLASKTLFTFISSH